jgi:hypothetical protein
VVLGYDLKVAERYDASCRITQCFKYQKYGHISSVCSNTEICGHCGSSHNTETCAGISPAPRKRCAACHGGEYTSWSAEYPARAKEILRVKTARRALSRLFLISALPPTLREAFGAPEESPRDKGWSTVAIKKRKLAGRPLGAISKAKIINKTPVKVSSVLLANRRAREAQVRRLRLSSKPSTRKWNVILYRPEARHKGQEL